MKRLFLATVLFTLAILSGGNMQGQEVTVIASYQDFLNIPDNATGNYKQTADIEFPNNTFPAKSFAGTYDGQGFSIKSSGTQNKTLFNEISGGKGKVKNLVIDGVRVSEGWVSSGGLLCRKFSNGRIENITVTNCNYSNSVYTGTRPSGGLIGIMNGGTVSNCCVKGTTITSRKVTGGLIGQMTGGTVEYSSFTGNTVSAEQIVSTDGFCHAGGIVGEISGGTINACYASGTIQTKNGNSSSYECGIAGNPSSSANSVTISNCYNGTDKEATHGNTTNTNVISGGNDNLDTIIAVLNSGLTSPAFVEENGEIVTVTAADGGVYESKASGSRFDIKSTWEKTSYATSPKYIIKSSTSVSIEPGVTLPEGIEIEIKYGGSLINKTDNAVHASLENNILPGWNCMGFPVKGESNLAPLAASGAPDIWALAFKYGENKWDEDNFLHYNDDQKDSIQAGNGIMAFVDREYRFNVEGETVNEQLIVTNNVTGSNETGRWMALANPYPAAIDPSAVVNSASVQGQLLYIYMPVALGNRWWSTEELPGLSIPAGRGFMLNMKDGETSFTFNKSMIKGYDNSPAAKSAVAKRDFLTVSVSTDGYKVPVMFAKNEAAREDYDIFDANKLFGDGSLAEPYLLCNGINLCKEEVNSLPYTATMNIKSGEARSVEIIADKIPEGYSLTLIDNEEEIVMNQGDVYTVNIASGENADRFKLKIGEKNVSITEIEAAEELNIRNNNRNIIIEGGKNIRAEVYNTLGQKVYETTARNFNIEGVAAGAYVIKVQSGKAVQSQKVIIR